MPICEPCREGGWLKKVPEMEADARFAHSLCQDPATCPCQHRIDAVYIKDEDDD